GLVLYNNKGDPVQVLEPFFTPHRRFDLEAHGKGSVCFTDPLQRVVCQLEPDGSYAKTLFGAWEHRIFDGNDNGQRAPWADPDVGGLVAPYYRGQQLRPLPW